ncbi:MAG: cell envelope integrity protein TolA [Candidatus Glassbacteria bacterium]
MRKALLFSFVSHILLVVALVIGGLGRGSAQAPPKVYKIKLVSAPPAPKEKKKPTRETGNVTPPPPVKVKKIRPKRKKVEERIKKEVSRRPKVKDSGEKKGVGGVELEGEEFPFPYYLELFVTKISRNWKNPVNQPENELSALVYFRITRTGRISDISLKKGSGNFIYDQAAMRAVLASNPLPPLPDGYAGDFLGVTCEIVP